MSLTLIGLHYSPWTERARWGLEHHGLAYRYVEHTPLLGEPLLKFRARGTGKAKASVPLLLTPTGPVGDSFEILQYADGHGSGESLRTDAPEVAALVPVVERGLQAARARVTARILADPNALREAAEAAVPAFLAGLARPVAAAGARHIARKYSAPIHDVDAAEATIRDVLLELRQRLNGGRFICGTSFSAADILGTTFINAICPVDVPWIRMKPATRAAWLSPEFEQEFADLVAWRDAWYREKRVRPR